MGLAHLDSLCVTYNEKGNLQKMRVTVIIPTLGRPQIVRRGIDRISEQTRWPNRIIVVATRQEDVEGAEDSGRAAELYISPKGLCRQRNLGLALVSGDTDIVLFIDDDFVMAPDYIEQMEAFFFENPECAGLTGAVLADGAHGQELSESHARDVLRAWRDDGTNLVSSKNTLYGCNMSFRISAIRGMFFDENLPLYGWQEDIDFSYRLSFKYPLYKNRRLKGVHLGTKSGRTPGKRMGYSQIANPVYLLSKRSMPRLMAWQLMARNLAANALGIFIPSPNIDRRGRFWGNLLAIRDVLTGRSRPSRILQL